MIYYYKKRYQSDKYYLRYLFSLIFVRLSLNVMEITLNIYDSFVEILDKYIKDIIITISRLLK